MARTSEMRILYYNWVDYLDDERRGGGVSIYQRNLMAAIGPRPGVTAHFLSAGVSHDLRPGPPRWEALRHGPQEGRDRRFEIVNSATLAPAHHGFGSPAQVSDAATEAVFFDFLEKTGPYDVVHFNNLEGLPAGVLRLAARFAQTRVVLSLHNYYPFCPQVNLWHRERETCDDFEGGRKCVSCLPHVHDARHMRLSDGLAYRLKRLGLRPGTWAFDVAFRGVIRTGGLASRALRRLKRRGADKGAERIVDKAAGQGGGGAAAGFAARRASMVDLINRHCDTVLCVSEAVRTLALGHGIRPDIARTSYIGSREAEAFSRHAPRIFPARDDGTLCLAYLGYMRRDKGFPFLLRALEEMPAEMAGRLRIKVAARRGEAEMMTRLAALAPKLAALEHHDGYNHGELDSLLADVDVGLIPVMWHDNLPQVAIEMHARRLALLCSDMGGAQELGGCAQMVFRAGDVEAFRARIAALLAGEVDMDAYWRGAMAPVGMVAHVDELMAVYGDGAAD